MRKQSTRYAVLQIFSGYPEGIPAGKIKILVTEKYPAHDRNHTSAMVSQEVRRGLLKIEYKKPCGHCGALQNVYFLTPLGLAELENAL